MLLFVVIPISKLLYTLFFLCTELGNMPQVLLPSTFFHCHLGVYLLSLVKNFVIWLCLQWWSNLAKKINKQTNKQKSLEDECARSSSQMRKKCPNCLFFSWCRWWKCGFGCDATMVTFVAESPTGALQNSSSVANVSGAVLAQFLQPARQPIWRF
jgi:hypothetical protein